MELRNDTNNDNVVYEAQDGSGGPGGPKARELFLYAANDVVNPKIDIESVRNALGAAGPLPNKGEARTVCGLAKHEPINLVFYSKNGSGLKWLAEVPGATDAGRYRLYEPEPGIYSIAAY